MCSFPLPHIERLGTGEGERLRAIRLPALRDSPDAFDTTFEEAVAFPRENWDRQLKKFATFVATVNDRDVGLVRGTHHDHLSNAGYLISMWVAPEARRHGIGSALIDAVVDWARSQGLSRLFLDVGEGNSAAIALYTRKSFICNGEMGALSPPQEHIREVQMVLTI